MSLSPKQQKLLRRIFNDIDTDQSGFIERHELNAALKRYGKEGHGGADIILVESDQNGDGRVNFSEFCEAAMFSTNRKGVPTENFNAFIRTIAKIYVRESDTQTKSYLAEYSCWPPPLFMLTISLAQLGVYIYYANEDCTSKDIPVGLECPTSFSSPLAFRPGCRVSEDRRDFVLKVLPIYLLVLNACLTHTHTHKKKAKKKKNSGREGKPLLTDRLTDI